MPKAYTADVANFTKKLVLMLGTRYQSMSQGCGDKQLGNLSHWKERSLFRGLAACTSCWNWMAPFCVLTGGAGTPGSFLQRQDQRDMAHLSWLWCFHLEVMCMISVSISLVKGGPTDRYRAGKRGDLEIFGEQLLPTHSKPRFGSHLSHAEKNRPHGSTTGLRVSLSQSVSQKTVKIASFPLSGSL